MRHAVQVWVDDDLSVVTQVDRLKLVELLTPLLDMGHVGFIAREEIARSKVNQDFTVRISREHLDVLGIVQIHFAEFARILRAARIELAHEFVVALHPDGAG